MTMRSGPESTMATGLTGPLDSIWTSTDVLPRKTVTLRSTMRGSTGASLGWLVTLAGSERAGCVPDGSIDCAPAGRAAPAAISSAITGTNLGLRIGWIRIVARLPFAVRSRHTTPAAWSKRTARIRPRTETIQVRRDMVLRAEIAGGRGQGAGGWFFLLAASCCL